MTICLSAQLLWRRANTQNVIFLNLINSTDNTKLFWYTLQQRQHHSFFRNLPPLFIYNYHYSITRIKNNNNNNKKNHHDSQRLTKCDPLYDFRDKGDNTHTTHIQHTNTSCRMPIVLVTFTNSSEKYIDL